MKLRSALVFAAAAGLGGHAAAACSTASLTGVHVFRLDLKEYGRTICTIDGKYRFDGAGHGQEYGGVSEGDCGGGRKGRSGPSDRVTDFNYDVDRSCRGTLDFSGTVFTLFINPDGSFSATRANSQADIEIHGHRADGRGIAPRQPSGSNTRSSGSGSWASLNQLQREKLSQRWIDAAESARMWSTMCCRGKEISYACDQFDNEMTVLSESCKWGEKTMCQTWASLSGTHRWCMTTR